MGSDSDAPVMDAACGVLTDLGISWEMTVASAHRSPARVMKLVDEAPARGVRVFIVGAGAAAHLAGVVAAHTPMPVIGVPIDSSALKGLDAGVHGLIAVNREAGGHAGTRDPRALLDEVGDLGLPVVCAGGIGDEAQFVDVLRMGYAGVQLGTRFIATTECRAHRP